MIQLNETIDFYLKNDSNYAVMITGDWGVGKTYYFKKILSERIENTDVYTNPKKKYKPIIVSLFGLSSIEEIQTEIFLSIYPLLKNKTVKLGSSIAKSLVKGILKLKGLSEYGDIISETETNKNDWINFNELVICFDDFERLSDKLSIEELVGYINSLVENENVKIIILANQDKIPNTNYYILKEKVIGNTIEFIQDLEYSFDSLISEKFSGFKNYTSFLKKYKAYIIEVFSSDTKNLRTLSFILTYFQTIYSSYITTVKKGDKLNEYEDEILKKILKFTIAIGILYKHGKISYNKRENLESFNFFNIDNLLINGQKSKKEKSEEEKSIREQFIEKYYKDDIYNFYPSIYDFITGGSSFNPENLISELKSNLHIQDNSISPEYEVYQKLSYPQVFELTEDSYRKLTREVLNYCEQGKYGIQEYTTVFYFITRFDNPLNLNLEKLEKRVIKGLYKGVPNYTYTPSLDFYLRVNEENPNKENLLKIREVALKINERLIKNENDQKYKEIEDLYSQDFEKFYITLIDKTNEYRYLPIFENFNLRNFYSFFINSNGKIKWQMIKIFEKRYPEYPGTILKPEIKFLEKLLEKLDKKCNSMSNKGMTSFVYHEFKKVIIQSIERLSGR